MRAVVQRVKSASVSVEGSVVSSIDAGLLVYLALERGDESDEEEWIIRKIVEMRIFEDTEGKMNLPVGDRPILLVSQFTLTGDFRRGRRPGFELAMPVEQARSRWPLLVERFHRIHPNLQTGTFQASMLVASVNDGPATFWLDSTNSRDRTERGPQ